jgi:hypothetical protein
MIAVLAMSFVMAIMIVYTRDWWCSRAQPFCLPERIEATVPEATRAPLRAGSRGVGNSGIPTPVQSQSVTPTADFLEDFGIATPFEFPTPVIVPTPYSIPPPFLDLPTSPVFPTLIPLPTTGPGGSDDPPTSRSVTSPSPFATDPFAAKATATPSARATGYPGPGDASGDESRFDPVQR